MGPLLILDKSVVHGLSKRGSYEQGRYFCTNVTPLFALEVLADLRKGDPEDPRTVRKLQAIAGRALPLSSYVSEQAETMCYMSLLGSHPTRTRQVQVSARNSRSVTLSDGSRMRISDQGPVADALQRWEMGLFRDSEALLAQVWRDAHKSAPFEELRRSMQIPQHRLESMSDVDRAVRAIIGDEATQRHLLRWFVEGTWNNSDLSRWVLHRWDTHGFRYLRDFSWYATHCLRVELMFDLGFEHELISTRGSNPIDMRYYWYTPFCHAFASCDHLHAELAPFLLDDDQVFLHGPDLIAELGELGTRRELARTEQEYPEVEPGTDSIIRRTWDRFMPRGFQPQSPTRKDLGTIDDLPPLVQEALRKSNELNQEEKEKDIWP